MGNRKEKEQWKKETLQTVIWRCYTLHFWLRNSILARLPHFPAVSIIIRVPRSQQNTPSCLPPGCWQWVLCVTGAKLYLTKCQGICAPIFAQLLFRDVNFPLAICLGRMYLFYKLVSDFSKFTLMKKNQHFLSTSSYYIYQKYSIVKFQCLFLVRYTKDFTC